MNTKTHDNALSDTAPKYISRQRWNQVNMIQEHPLYVTQVTLKLDG